ncbi:MAG: hypothetical protein GX971_02355, partial [Firmicutes bacterium]|nr:hypothetical protein [Bacillota bacterium]
MDELLDVLREHLRRYPQMTALDQVKLIYQNEFGPGHFILDEQASLERLEEEFNSLQQAETVANLFENIGNGLVRLNLRALGDVLPLATVNRFFTLTAHEKRGCVERFESKLEILKEHFSGVDLDAYLEEYKNSGYPAVSHSEQYKKHYAPSYRIISSDFALYFPVFKQIEKLLREKECIIVAIDGRSGSGKSFLAGLLQAVYGSPIISMD